MVNFMLNILSQLKIIINTSTEKKCARQNHKTNNSELQRT